MPKSRIIIIGIIGIVVVFFALIFLGIIPGLRISENPNADVALEFWGVFDEPRVIEETIKLVPGFQVSYKEFNPATYEQELIDALAAGRGPDILMIHNSWLPKHFDKLVPASQEQISISSFRKLFPTIVEQNFAPDGFIYALPLYIDTLALFYNKDIFDSNSITSPPKSWIEFENIIPRLRQLDASGKIVRAAAAIGGSNKNINRGTDILNNLMLQTGAPMVSNDFTKAEFANDGINSLGFYTKFANPGSEFYTWNDSLINSIDSFANESSAIIFNYSYQIPIIKEKNPFLNFAVAEIPQPANASKKVAYPNYWGLAVSNSSINPQVAWSFVLSLAANNQAASFYLSETGRPPALKDLISANLDNPELGVFANQALFARSWPQIDNNEIDKIFSKMIDEVINGRSAIDKALEEAEADVTDLMDRKKRNF